MVKNRWIASLLLAAAVGCSSSSSGSGKVIVIVLPRWENLFRTPTTVHLRAVIFTNPSQGIVAGDSTGIFRTNNGDFATPVWTQQEHEPFNLGGDIVAIDGISGVVHAVGTDPGGNARYWSTTNSVNWVAPPTVGGVNFTAVAVPTTTDAFYLRQNGEILHNNGTTVLPTSPVVPGTPGGNWFALKVFESGGNLTSIAYVGGEDGGGTPTLYYHDPNPFVPPPMVPPPPGWFQANLPVGLTQPIVDFSFQNVLEGFAISGDVVIRTWNAKDWIDVSGSIAGGGVPLNAIHFPIIPGGSSNLDFGCVVGDGATIYVTQDGNVLNPTWTAGTINNLTVPGVNLHDVWFANLTTGYAVGDDGVVLRTTDAGVTWDDISNGGVIQAGVGTPWPNFNDVAFTRDGSIGLAVGDVWNTAASVWRTLDGGATWTLFNTGLPNVDFFGVSIPEVGGSGNLAYICGDVGAIQITRDLQGAGTWAGPTSGAPPIVPYRRILFASGDNFGIVVGDNGNVLDVANDSLAVPSPTFVVGAPTAAPPGGQNYQALSRVYTPIAGGGLRYYTGSDAGLISVMEPVGVPTPITSWVTMAPLPPGAPAIQAMDSPPSILEPSGASVFAGAANGNVYAFVGGSWFTTTPAPSAAITGVAFPYGDPGNPALHAGVAINANGIFTTLNSGTTWTVSPDHTDETLQRVWMSSLVPGLGFTAGANGTILRTRVGGLP